MSGHVMALIEHESIPDAQKQDWPHLPGAARVRPRPPNGHHPAPPATITAPPPQPDRQPDPRDPAPNRTGPGPPVGGDGAPMPPKEKAPRP